MFSKIYTVLFQKFSPLWSIEQKMIVMIKKKHFIYKAVVNLYDKERFLYSYDQNLDICTTNCWLNRFCRQKLERFASEIPPEAGSFYID